MLVVLIVICVKFLIKPYKNYFAEKQQPIALPPLTLQPSVRNKNENINPTTETQLDKENSKNLTTNEKK